MRYLLLLTTLGVAFGCSLIHAHSPATDSTDYRQPSPDITDLLLAAAPPTPLVHARSGQVALLQKQAVIPLSRLSQPWLGLAGYRFNPVTQTSGLEPLVTRVEILSARQPGLAPRIWQAGTSYGFDHLRFSPNGRWLSALKIRPGEPARQVIYDIEKGRERELKVSVNSAWGAPCQWAGNEALLCRLVPLKRGPHPEPMLAPLIVEHTGGPAPTRTYNNLLESHHDDALFTYHFATELGLVNLRGKVSRYPATRGMLRHFRPSSDGRFAIVKRLHHPWSRLVPARRFPTSVEVWDLEQAEALYSSAPQGFGVDSDHNNDPRRLIWKPGNENVVGYIQAYKDEEGNNRYDWMSLALALGEQPRTVASSTEPFYRFGWTTAGTPWYSTRSGDGTNSRVYIVYPKGPSLIWQGEVADRYNDPGYALGIDGHQGAVLEVNGQIYLAGDGLGPAGPQPFLDTFNLQSREVQRLFTSEYGVFEQVLAVLDIEGPVLLTSRESEATPPSLYQLKGNQRVSVHLQASPWPALDKATRQTIQYRRADGVPLNATLYLPEGYDGSSQLPTLVWIYPYEFAYPEHAGQLDVRNFRFHKVKGPSPLAAVLQGYAVIVNPTVPIIYGKEGMNDNYIPQLVSSAEAVVNYLVDKGISDPGRIAVGGRSYGAFSTANLLVHSRLFATGVAMSGAYNRTLTPFGFQHEKRSFWDATDLYTSISPFFHANDITAPLLLVHGGADPNPGTPPLQARRFFHALVGEGVDVRYVELPDEGHHYWAKESVLHAATEMIDWLDRTIGPALKTPGDPGNLPPK